MRPGGGGSRRRPTRPGRAHRTGGVNFIHIFFKCFVWCRAAKDHPGQAVRPQLHCQNIRTGAAGASAPLRIGAFSGISGTWRPKVLQEHHVRYPEVTFDIQVGTNTLIDWLLKGAVDLALGDAARCRAFRWSPLMDDPHFAVLPASLTPDGSGISQEELAAYPFVMAPMNALNSCLSVLPITSARSFPIKIHNSALTHTKTPAPAPYRCRGSFTLSCA